MTRKRKRSSVLEIGTGPARVKIHTVNRKDGYSIFSLYWKEGGKRKVRHPACMKEARLIPQQTTVRLTDGWSTSAEVTMEPIEPHWQAIKEWLPTERNLGTALRRATLALIENCDRISLFYQIPAPSGAFFLSAFQRYPDSPFPLPSGPTQWLFHGPSAEKFQAAPQKANS